MEEITQWLERHCRDQGEILRHRQELADHTKPAPAEGQKGEAQPPAHSIIRGLFRQEQQNWIIAGPIEEDNWNACWQTLEGHSDWVSSVAFSPDSKSIASGLN